MTDRTQPDSASTTSSTHIIRYALELGLLWVDGDGRDKVREALDALDTLEAQLEAIGAGGVSGPLMGIAAPPTAQAGGWISVDERLPEPGTPVLLDIGKKYPIRALWAAKHTVEAADDDTDWAEYDEATETYYCPEGWYEWNEHEETHWAVSTTPCAWAPLPPTTSAGSGKGE